MAMMAWNTTSFWTRILVATIGMVSVTLTEICMHTDYLLFSFFNNNNKNEALSQYVGPATFGMVNGTLIEIC